MKLSNQAKKELLDLSQTEEFKSLEKKIFAENPGTVQATDQFIDFIQFFHNMANHPTRQPRPFKGKCKL